MRAILRFIRHGRTARDPVPQVVIPEPMALRVGELLHDRKHAGRPRPPGRIVEEIDTGECCWCDIREADTDEAALVVVTNGVSLLEAVRKRSLCKTRTYCRLSNNFSFFRLITFPFACCRQPIQWVSVVWRCVGPAT